MAGIRKSEFLHISIQRSLLEVLRACTPAPSDVRLALTVGEVSFTSVFQVILLLAGSFVTHLDMPPPCGLPEGKAASLLRPGEDNVVGVNLCLNCLHHTDFTCVRALLLVSTTKAVV